jgi:hypothetical protein
MIVENPTMASQALCTVAFSPEEQSLASLPPFMRTGLVEVLREAALLSFLTIAAVISALFWAPVLAATQFSCFWPLWCLSRHSVTMGVALQLFWLPVVFWAVGGVVNRYAPPMEGSTTSMARLRERVGTGSRVVGLVGGSAIGGLIAALGWFAWTACLYLWPLWAVPSWPLSTRLVVALLWATLAVSIATTVRLAVGRLVKERS